MRFSGLIFALFFSVFAFGQTVTNAFTDDFNEGSVWGQFDDEEGSGKISNGKYVLKSKKDDGFPESCVYPFVKWNDDFSIEATYMQTTFHAHNISGVIWAKEGNTFNAFFIRMNGFFQIVTIKNDNVESKIVDWTKTELVKTTNHNNTLKVSRERGFYKFSINGKEVYSAPFERFFSKNEGMGVIVEGLNTIELDKFSYKQNVKINVAADDGSPKKKINLGPNINSQYKELNPIITADGKNLYYVIEGNPSNSGGGLQDVWVSSKTDTSWGKGKNLGMPINNIVNNGVISVSPDNNTLYLTGRYKKNGVPGGEGFSYSTKTSTGWSDPMPINIKNFYNESEYQEACFGPNKKVMIFTAKRKDTYGGNDLYVSFMETKDLWSEPVNLGVFVNTELDEASPFLAADGKTLYFSSNGRPGLGDMDVYVTKRLDNSFTKWSEPVNLGPSINSVEFDAYFSVSAKGDYAYMVTTSKSMGEEDIVKIQLSESAKPEPVVVIHGKVFDAKTKKPLVANLTYEELPIGKELGNATTDPNTGEYKIVLPFEKVYGIFAEKAGYMPQNDNIDLSQVHEYAEIEKDLYLSPVEVGEKMIMNNIFFAQGTANILDKSYPELDRLVDILKKSPKMEIEIGGHTDNVGETAANQLLSEQRVAEIIKYFVSKGIVQQRLKGVGYGDSQPIASNLREETRKLNRRVEIKILKK